MDLSVESYKYRLRQIDKTVKILENVAFSGSHFLKVHIYCKLETYLFMTLSLLVIVYSSLFYHFVKHRPETKILKLSLQNEIDVIAYFTLTC